MKILLALMALAVGLQAVAEDTVVRGNDARTIMETLAGAGFEFEGLDDDWVLTPISVKSGPILCHYSVAQWPDQWLSNARCYKGNTTEGPVLQNSLALTRIIAAYGEMDAGAGNRWILVDNINCMMLYKHSDYVCTISTPAQGVALED